MTLFDRLKQAASQVAGEASRQAEILKVQGQMGQTEQEIERVLVEAGRRARELMRQQKVDDPDLRLLMGRVDELDRHLSELREHVAALMRGGTEAQAPAAGEAPAAQPSAPVSSTPVGPVAPAPEAFRPPAAQEATAPTPAAQPGAIQCSDCGAALAEGARFCGECGARVQSDS